MNEFEKHLTEITVDHPEMENVLRQGFSKDEILQWDVFDVNSMAGRFGWMDDDFMIDAIRTEAL